MNLNDDRKIDIMLFLVWLTVVLFLSVILSIALLKYLNL